MSRITHTLTRLLAPAAAVAFTGGCGGGGTAAAPAPAASTPVASTTSTSRALPLPPPRTSPAPAPTAARAESTVEQVATRYLAARENAISYTHPSPRSWLAQVRPVMTAAGWQRLADSLGDSGGFPAATARAHKWSVRVAVLCRHNPDAGPASDTAVTLTCAVTDRTVDAGGVPVPHKDLPSIWPYEGAQPPALLAMRNVAGRWLVYADQTGQAG